MNKLVSGKCPNCGANIDLPNDLKTTYCAYCGSQINVEEAVEKLKIELSGKIEVDGINSLSKLYKNAESYLKLQDFDNAFYTYCSIIDDNPEEIAAYKGALNSLSYNMTREASLSENYPDGFSNRIDRYIEYMNKLDNSPEVQNFIDSFTKYYKKQKNNQEQLELCREINTAIDSLRDDFSLVTNNLYDSYLDERVESNYNTVISNYELLDYNHKDMIYDYEKIKEDYSKYKKRKEKYSVDFTKKGFFKTSIIGKAIKWFIIFWVVVTVLSTVCAFLASLSQS